ncbi:tRNA (cytosine-5-)-methyltransferase ncl1 [Fusarium falciforme]|nr:tRNA (cytosine-5-)-methyltransferase ncl1 [Fusarium falciforme]
MADASTNGHKRPLESEDAEDQPAKKAKTEVESSASATPVPQAQAKNQEGSKPRRNGPVEEPFKYLDPAHPTVQNIKDFYHISSRFPDDRYMVRNEMGEPAKAIYYTSALLRDILTENEGRGIKFIHGGVRMYMKQDAPSAEVCRWRIQAEGMPILQGYWERFDEIGERVRDIGMGCAVLRVEPDGSDPDFAERMALPIWKSIHSLNLMLPKEDRSAMLLRIFNDTSPLINVTLEAKVAQQAKESEAGEKEAVDVADLPSPEEPATEPAKEEAAGENKVEEAA